MNAKDLDILTPLMEQFLIEKKLIIENAPIQSSYNRISINKNTLNKTQNPYFIEIYLKKTTTAQEDFFFSFINFINNKLEDRLLIKFIKFKSPTYTSDDSENYEKKIINFLLKTKKRQITLSYIQQKKLLSKHIFLINELLPSLGLNYTEQRILFNTISTLNVFSTQIYQNKVYLMVKNNFKNPEQYNKNFIFLDTNTQELTSSKEQFSASLFIDKKKTNAIIISNIDNNEIRSAEIIIKKIIDYLSNNFQEHLKFDQYIYIDRKNIDNYEIVFIHNKEKPRITLIQKIFEDSFYSVLKENKNIFNINNSSFSKEKIESIIYDDILFNTTKEQNKKFKV